MPLPLIAKDLFPNVPNLAGVPLILRDIHFPVAVLPVLSIVDSLGLANSFTVTPQWGLFDDSGNAVLIADSVVEVSFRKEHKISSFPVELGTFASYNKVELPFEVTLRMTKGGSESERSQFLDSLETITGDTNLYTITTPEKNYLNANVGKYDYRRQSREGANLIIADLHLTEIRQVDALFTSVTLPASSVAEPSAASPVNGGKVAVKPPSPSMLSTLAKGATTFFSGLFQ